MRVDGRLHVHMAKVASVETLLNVERLAARKSSSIHPTLVVESRRIHYQRVLPICPSSIPSMTEKDSLGVCGHRYGVSAKSPFSS